MSLLPKFYSYICDGCLKPFESDTKLNPFGRETLCKICEMESHNFIIGEYQLKEF